MTLAIIAPFSHTAISQPISQTLLPLAIIDAIAIYYLHYIFTLFLSTLLQRCQPPDASHYRHYLFRHRLR